MSRDGDRETRGANEPDMLLIKTGFIAQSIGNLAGLGQGETSIRNEEMRMSTHSKTIAKAMNAEKCGHINPTDL